MNFHFSFPLTICFTCLFLASCATVEHQADIDSAAEQAAKEKQVLQNKMQSAFWQEQTLKRQKIKSWEIRGRLGIQTQDNGGTLDLIWKQASEEFSIRLIAPLAAGNYHIQGEKDHANIRYPDGSSTNIENTNEVFLTSLEVDLPSSAIKDWVRGLPANEMAVDKIEWNEQGLIHRIKQSGWNVEMSKYAGSTVQLPHAIYISREDDEDLDIRFLLRQWMLDD